MDRFRVRPEHVGKSAVYVTALGTHVTPSGSEVFGADDPVVKEHPWLFVSDRQAVEESEAEPPARRPQRRG